MAEQTHAELAAEIRGGNMEDRAWMIDALDRAAAALEAMAAPTHDHAGEPKLWCVTHQHVHIARVPRFTYLCKDCGWGQWYGDQAREHEFWTQENLREAHTTYEVEHEMIPIVEAAPSIEGDRHALDSVLGAVVFNASNHPNPTAVLGRDVSPLREKLVQAVLTAGFTRLDTTTEWGVRYKNLADEPVYVSYGDDNPRVSSRASMTVGDVLVSREVTAWRPVDPAVTD